jgi:probable rRNA maturation factor
VERPGLVILQKRIAGLSAQALDRFVLRARKTASLRGTVNVLVTSSAAMRSLNFRFRSQDKATDVLSFPSQASSGGRDAKGFAGEIAISADIAAQNAVRLGHPAAVEIKILALHGILHLAGFDHERDNGQMARKEADLRRALRLPSALIERSQPRKDEPSAPRRAASTSRKIQRMA